MLKKLHFCCGRASLLKYHEALKFDFEFVETKFLSVLGGAPCKFYGCHAWGHLLQGTAAGPALNVGLVGGDYGLWIKDSFYQCLGSGNAKKQNLN